MMATMKAYFDYSFSLMCGIPLVTLLGEKADWEDVARRAEKLRTYGKECEVWYEMLAPVLAHFVRAFDAPDSEENLDFWQKVAHYRSGGSGPTWLSGWITAFCVFSEEGKWLGLPLHEVCQIIDNVPRLCSGHWFYAGAPTWKHGRHKRGT